MMAEKKKKPKEKDPDTSGRTRSLRDDAEKKLAHIPKISPTLKGQTPDELTHELREHQIELEMQAEEALRDSEAMFRLLFNSQRDAVAVHKMGKDGQPTHFIQVNDVACERLGYTREEMLGLSPQDIDAPDRSGQVPAIIEKLYKNKQVLFETEHVCKDGHRIPVEVSTVLFQLGDSQATMSVARDITERKRAEEALHKSEKQYRSLLENVPELILVHRNGIILYTNPAAIKSLGYQPHEALNKPVTDFIAPEFHERVASAICRRMSGEEVEPYEIDVMGKDGSRRTMIISGNQIEFHGEPASLIILNDITELKALHDAVLLANKKLNLLSSVTRHDIINQLFSLYGYLKLSEDFLHDPVKIKEFITKQQNIARTIEAQIHFTKDYQNLGMDRPEWQNLNAVIHKACSGLPMRDIRVEVDPKNLEILADRLLERVFYNLVDNALKYAGVRMKMINISSQESSRGLRIICEDDGIGISEGDKERLFTRGFGKHTGFGLFLSREILAITGITITENGEPGKGARFEITVPDGAWRMTRDGAR